MREWHLLGQARLAELEEQVMIGHVTLKKVRLHQREADENIWGKRKEGGYRVVGARG